MVNRVVSAVSAVVYTVGFVLVSSIPGGGGDTTTADFDDFYVNDDQTAIPVIGAFLIALGAIGLMWFFQTATDTSDIGRFGRSAGMLGVALVAASASILAAPAGMQNFGDAEFVGQGVAHAFAAGGFIMMLVPGSLLLGAAIAAICASGRRSGRVPSWLAITGYIAAILQLVAVIWLPSFAVPLWILAAAAAGVWGMGGEEDDAALSRTLSRGTAS